MRKNKGITLIALVVTIIVLLILAGISIAMLTGTNGIITRTNEAREENVKGKEREQIKLAYGTEKSFLLEEESTEAVKAEDLENRLKSDGAKVKKVEEEDVRLKVTFDTGNVYYVDEDGNITDGTPDIPSIIGEIEKPKTSTGEEFSKPHGVIEIAWLDLNNNVIEKPLSPNLSNMQKVGWDSASNEITPASDNEWYDYNANKWANAKNPEDGSYFVWIPRYAYRIIYFDTEENKKAYIDDNTSKAGIVGYSTIHGIINNNGEVTDGTQNNIKLTVQTEGYRDYIPHPAFLGRGYENIGGGFGDDAKGISGIWFAKYEMGREDSLDNGTTWITYRQIGHQLTTKAGANEFIRAVSKPGVRNWSAITINYCYENSYHYDRNKDSHLMKNSEWGAVAYLTHSKYGRNGEEVTVNFNGYTYYTGGGAKTSYKNNTNQSSTGNIFGIYDLNGNASEFVAAFNQDFLWYDDYGSRDGIGEFASYNGASTKYATAYNNSWREDLEEGYFAPGDVSRTGDGIREVWVSGYRGWFSDGCYITGAEDIPYMTRSGSHYRLDDHTGVFCSSSHNGNTGSDGFRVVLIN